MTTPIAWQAWNNAARQQAHAEQKIIMVYCGSDLDHWSARWLREIESNAELVDSINQVCVPVQVAPHNDLELSMRIQEVLAVTSESQGWPAVMWLTPSGNPIGATPYRPLLDGEKMRGFAPMFIEVVEAWYTQREAVDADVADMRQAWRFADTLIAENVVIPLARSVDALEAHCMHQADELEGGFGTAPRDPAFSLLAFLLTRLQTQPNNSSMRKHVVKSLHALIAGGIHDHLQGGFFRASIDASWNIPFFEKCLIDQARMAQLLCRAATVCEEPVFGVIAARCLDYVHDYLCVDTDTGLCAHGIAAESIGAQQQPINGAAYLWSYAGIEDVIGKQAATIINKRFLSDQRCFVDDEFAVLAIRDELNPNEREQLPRLCQRLLVARLERPQPQRDETILLYEQAALLESLCAYVASNAHAHAHANTTASMHTRFTAWAAQIANYLQDPSTQYRNARDCASAALAVLHYQMLPNQASLKQEALKQESANKKINPWLKNRADQLRAVRRDNGSLGVSDQAIFADAVMLGPDSEDHVSPVAQTYQLWRALGTDYAADADALLTSYAALIKVSPMSYAGLLNAYLETEF